MKVLAWSSEWRRDTLRWKQITYKYLKAYLNARWNWKSASLTHFTKGNVELVIYYCVNGKLCHADKSGNINKATTREDAFVPFVYLKRYSGSREVIVAQLFPINYYICTTCAYTNNALCYEMKWINIVL